MHEDHIRACCIEFAQCGVEPRRDDCWRVVGSEHAQQDLLIGGELDEFAAIFLRGDDAYRTSPEKFIARNADEGRDRPHARRPRRVSAPRAVSSVSPSSPAMASEPFGFLESSAVEPRETFTRPSTSRSISTVTAPGRRTVGGSLVRSSTVDSTPIVVGATIDDEVDASVEVVDHVRRLSRAGAGEEVGAWCRHGDSRCLNERAGHGMQRHSDRDCGKPCGDLVGYLIRLRHDQRQRSRPEAAGESFNAVRYAGGERSERINRGDVNDQRIVWRSLLCREEPQHGLAVECIHAKPVDCFRWEGYQAAASKTLRGPGNRSGVRVSGATRITSVIGRTS